MTRWLAPAGPFFHGGVPGLGPGDQILPPSATGTRRRMRDYYPVRATRGTHPWLMRDDLVFFTPLWKAAVVFAAAYPEGAVYEVDPVGAISLDPDTPGGEAWRAPAATVVRVVSPLVELPRDLTEEQLAHQLGPGTALLRRIVSLLRNESPRPAGCERGHVHWGQFGAAGLLLRHTGVEKRYLLQLRARGTQQGGSWGLPGGALGWGEPPYAGALREAREEMGALPELKPRVIGVDDHGGWTYYTAVADVAEPFTPSGGDGEGVAYRWCTAAEVPTMRLHPGLAEVWPRLADLVARY